MRKYYISSKTGLSGICKYSRDFYELVLKEKNYLFIDSDESHSAILSTITVLDHIHIEIGIFRKKEIAILLALLKANYQDIAITLHDPPLLKFPFYEFKNALLNKISKFYDIYINKFRASRKYINKVKTIYVLSKKGVEVVKSTYHVGEVYFLPHIVDEGEIEKKDITINNFIYFGFIGKNKGIGYALELHSRLLKRLPDINFYIAGTALGKEKIFYDLLKKKYKKNVHFLGYVPQEKLREVFENATFSLMPFKKYGFFTPFSGSVLYNLKMGKILFTTKVNAIHEVIEDGINGFYLSGKMDEDVETVSGIISNGNLLSQVKSQVYKYLLLHHTALSVLPELKD